MAEVLRCRDPWGRDVVVEDREWAKKVRDHPELAGQEDAVRQTIESPDPVNFDDVHYDLQCFYRRAMLPAAPRSYLKVVIRYPAGPGVAGGSGFFVSAHPRNRIKPKERRKWP